MTSPFFSRRARRLLIEAEKQADSAQTHFGRAEKALDEGRRAKAQAHLDSAAVHHERAKVKRDSLREEVKAPTPKKGRII